jgi:hypothetical protein
LPGVKSRAVRFLLFTMWPAKSYPHASERRWGPVQKNEQMIALCCRRFV